MRGLPEETVERDLNENRELLFIKNINPKPYKLLGLIYENLNYSINSVYAEQQ